MSSSSCTGPKPQKPDCTSAALRDTGSRPIHPWGRPLIKSCPVGRRRGLSPSMSFLPRSNRLYTAVSLSLLALVAVIPAPEDIGTAVSPSNFRSFGVRVRSTKTISGCRQRQLITRYSPGPLWRSAGGKTAGMSDCRHTDSWDVRLSSYTQTVGKCVELYSVEVLSWSSDF